MEINNRKIIFSVRHCEESCWKRDDEAILWFD